MAFFGRRRRSRFPGDMLERLELLGRFEMDPMGVEIGGGEIGGRCIVPFFADARADPPGFVADLRAVVAGDTGGFAAYGASCLVFDMFSEFRTPDALALLDDAIEVKRTLGLPTARLKGYELERWLHQHGPNTW